MDVGLLVVVLGSSWRVRLWCRRQMKMAGGAAGERGVCKCKFYVGDPLGLWVRVSAVFILENFASITPISAMAGAPLPPFEKVRCVGGFVGLAVSSVSSGGACPLPKDACWGDITA